LSRVNHNLETQPPPVEFQTPTLVAHINLNGKDSEVPASLALSVFSGLRKLIPSKPNV
jgi:hypothetical protein